MHSATNTATIRLYKVF